ncbi:anthranilate synthase component I [Anaerolentibacter hominis]|uniref:anthranilate synthase component I n=1 Tax=Anaerolentibacter hominis TaxID=3079009 RepID=UPI0031B81C1F
MIQPNCEIIEKLAEDYSVVPLCREIYADVITPITLLRKLSAVSSNYYLLESVEGGEKWGRYSFLGYDPVMRVTLKDGLITIREKGNTRTVRSGKPLALLQKILDGYKAPKLPDMPPFTGGFVGYFAYSMIGYAEPTLKIKTGEFNDYDVMLFDKVIAYDHLRQKICLIVNMKTDHIKQNYEKAAACMEQMAEKIREPGPLPETEKAETPEFSCNLSKEEYCRLVERTKEYIRDGDIFQAVISRRFSSPYRGDLINAYRVLRITNPSPYMVYMNMEGEEIISTSPETLVRLREGRLTTFPVAGSRPRGKTPEEDVRLEQELLADEKELSEHNMLVDLGRNDLGKISKFNSVKVTEYMMIHRYSKIMHICSQVESDILDSKNGVDAIEAVLPAGTLSGAPKIRACEIIEELEPEPRGIYGGALGYLDFTGDMDTCIAIRMAVKKKDKVYVQAGGGIVADSQPEKEYEESYNKALAVMNAIRDAGEVENG